MRQPGLPKTDRSALGQQRVCVASVAAHVRGALGSAGPVQHQLPDWMQLSSQAAQHPLRHWRGLAVDSDEFVGPVTADLPRAVWQPTNSHDRLLDFFAFAIAAACKSDLLAACKVAAAAAQHALPCNDARPFLDLSKQIHRV